MVNWYWCKAALSDFNSLFPAALCFSLLHLLLTALSVHFLRKTPSQTIIKHLTTAAINTEKAQLWISAAKYIFAQPHSSNPSKLLKMPPCNWEMNRDSVCVFCLSTAVVAWPRAGRNAVTWSWIGADGSSWRERRLMDGKGKKRKMEKDGWMLKTGRRSVFIDNPPTETRDPFCW